jgi:hypothetical protein
MILRLLLAFGLLCFLSLALSPAFSASHLTETRYSWPIVRDANGVIVRSTAVTREFQKIHPCPSTGLTYGPCLGWQKNHVIPLACAGADRVSNMQWIPVEIKTCAEWYCIDRFERKIYGKYPDTNCTAPTLKVTP